MLKKIILFELIELKCSYTNNKWEAAVKNISVKKSITKFTLTKQIHTHKLHSQISHTNIHTLTLQKKQRHTNLRKHITKN